MIHKDLAATTKTTKMKEENNPTFSCFCWGHGKIEPSLRKLRCVGGVIWVRFPCSPTSTDEHYIAYHNKTRVALP